MLEGLIKADGIFNIVSDIPIEGASWRVFESFANSSNAVRKEVDGRCLIIRDSDGDDRVLIGYQEDGF